MTPEECQTALTENLGRSLAQAHALEDILGNERHALEQKDSESLGKSATLKSSCADSLAALDSARLDIGRACGFGADVAALRELVAWSDGGTRLQDVLTEFVDSAERCRDLNASNGAIIRVRQAQINEALSLLRSGTAESDTYGPAGRIAGELGPRSLAQA